MEAEDQPKKVVKKKMYTMRDMAFLLENKDRYSGFGKMSLSTKDNRPSASFGKATRNAQEKVYANKANMKAFIGKNSNNYYDVTDKFAFKIAPNFSFARRERNTLETNAKYDYYTRGDHIKDLGQSDDVRRSRSPTYKVGQAKRFQDLRSSMDNPGAIYNVGHRLDRPEQPKFSFGQPPEHTKQGRKIEVMASTPVNVGPNSYFRRGYPDEVVKPKAPSYSVTRALIGKELFANRKADNETYELYSSVASQVRSKKTTEPQVSMPHVGREREATILTAHLESTLPRLKMPHPKF